MASAIIELTDIEKSFGGVQALSRGLFSLREGEIHSLIGENGAGKSTLMKILYGIHRRDSGTISIRGEIQNSQYTTRKAIEAGIGMVHQEFTLVNELTVLENIILGFEPGKYGIINFEEARSRINHYISEYGFDVQLNKRVYDISVGEAQKTEILKILYRGAKVVILDEPTAVLTPQEAVKLFDILHLLVKKQLSVIFISHRLNEVMTISDRITVMRGGRHINTVDKGHTTIPELAKDMVGWEFSFNTGRKNIAAAECILSVKDIFVPGDREHSKLRGIRFDLRRGETLGVAGVDGNGQNELVEAITGLRHVEKGSIIFKNRPIQNRSVKDIRESGLAHIPGDRNTYGLNRKFTIKENLIANSFTKKEFSAMGILKHKAIGAYADKLAENHDIRPRNTSMSTANLSGGNAQKVVFAREINTEFDLLIASQPTRGVDISSIETIRTLINTAKEQGKAILLVSADLDEILSLSDNIMVMFEGHIAGIIPSDKATEENVGLMMTGACRHEIQ
ncbi:MAG: ABC transporter ATP-binding protein [Spirochaetaceae bacterium]|jgi:simple sugar transport system ATP-binding protein|nr:ABC transporter ATP-binding protein [Spirochaetaceae bacterium]